MVYDQPATSLQRETIALLRLPGLALDSPRSRRRSAPSSLDPKQLPAPDWPVPDIAEESMRLFPVAADPQLAGCWWLRETATIAKQRTRTIVQVGHDEIECVDSEDSEIDIIEEFPVKKSQSTKEEDAAAISSSSPITPDGCKQNHYSSDELEILRGRARDTRMDDLGPTKRLLVSKFPNRTTNKLAEEYSPDEIRILEGEVEDLRIEDLDAEKRWQVQNLLCQSEITRDDEDGAETTKSNCDKDEAQSAMDHIRRTAVGITGGTLTVAGFALIPCPIIPGALVVYGGLLVLATEFDSAKRALDRVREPIEQWLADDDEKEGVNTAEGKHHNPRPWEDVIGHERKHDIDDEFAALFDTRRLGHATNCNDSDLEKDKPVKAMKQFLRNILIGDANKQNEKDNVPKGGSNGSTPIPGMDDRM